MTVDIHDSLREQPPPLPVPARALAVGAHPDDIEFGAGGTLARWAAAGAEVTMLIVTDGSKGTWDPSMAPARLAAIRKDEQRRAAQKLGAAHVVHLDHVDGELLYTMDLRAQICLQIRLHRPDVVFGHDPWKRYQLHPDHRAAGLGVVDGVVAARDHLFFPDQGVPAHRPGTLLLWSADEADHYEDIATTFDKKVDALLCHSSQGTTTMGGADSGGDPKEAFESRLRDHAAKLGELAGYEVAEAFKRIVP
ncbi:MAG: PIG-L deacetylase family protein [Acidimicrobiia bacterium]